MRLGRVNRLSACGWFLVFSLYASGASAAILTVNGDGLLTGAQNVIVEGNAYDVMFVTGLCSDVFDGCDEVSDFFFQNEAIAVAASQALLDQVIIDGPLGAFDTDPLLTETCNTTGSSPLCFISTPYGFSNPAPGLTEILTGAAVNAAEPNMIGAVDFAGPGTLNTDPAAGTTGLAVWMESAAQIPVSSTATLLGLGLLLLAVTGTCQKVRA